MARRSIKAGTAFLVTGVFLMVFLYRRSVPARFPLPRPHLYVPSKVMEQERERTMSVVKPKEKPPASALESKKPPGESYKELERKRTSIVVKPKAEQKNPKERQSASALELESKKMPGESYKSVVPSKKPDTKLPVRTTEKTVLQPPKCDSVAARIAASSVFANKIKKIDVLWNKETRSMSPSVKGQWQAIQRRGVSDYGQALDELLKVAPARNVFADWRKKGCVRCAVVGNSKNMLGSGYGPLIDANDVVFRINLCPLKGYEKDVGTKTTVHVVYPESASGYRPGSILMLVPFKVVDLGWLKSALTTHDFRGGGFWRGPPKSINASQILVAHPELLIEAKNLFHGRGGSYPSTGGMMLLASLHLCDKVNVFGFGLGPHGEFGHYYETIAGISITSHDGNAEAQMRESLEQEKIIKVFKGHQSAK
eukprot:m.178752 g.178752  ORF g.178752 m.178752 type:complete len:425 (+) comp39190_c0_seq8:101-1375(+)